VPLLAYRRLPESDFNVLANLAEMAVITDQSDFFA
jgi:hypothetical protein